MKDVKIHKMGKLQHKMKRRGEKEKVWMRERDKKGMGRGVEGGKQVYIHFLDIWGYRMEILEFPVMSIHYHGILMTLKILLLNVLCDTLSYIFNLGFTIIRKSALNTSFLGSCS